MRAFSINDESKQERGAIDKRMVGYFEGFARTSRRAVSPDQILVNLQIGLKIKGVANAPFLLARQGVQKFAPEYRRIFLRHRTGLGLF